MSGEIDLSQPAPPAPSPWAMLRQLIGLEPGPVEAPDPAAPPVPTNTHRGALGLFPTHERPRHAELFMSERTGDWIRVGCYCELNVDHWHTNQK